MNSQRERAAAFAVPVTNITILLMGVTSGIVSARLLAPGGRGELLSWQTWATVSANIANFGFAQAIVINRVFSSLPRARDFVRLLSVLCVTCVLTWGAFGLLLGSPVLALAGGLSFSAASAVGGLLPALAQRTGRMTFAYNIVRLLPQIATLATLVVMTMIGVRRADQVFLAISLVQGVVIAGLSAHARSIWPRTRAIRPTRVFWRSGFRLGPPGWTMYLFGQADLLIVTMFFTREQAGFYGVAAAAQGGILALGQSVAARWFSAKRDTNMRLTRKIVFEVLIVAGLPSIAVVAFAPTLVPLAFGPEFKPAVVVTMILAPAGLVRSVDALIWYHLIGHARSVVLTATRFANVGVIVAGGVTLASAGDHRNLSYMAAVTVAGTLVGLASLLVVGIRSYASPKADRVATWTVESPELYGLEPK
jgi:O-antigen/teichoic acid export membrane protein